MTNTTFDIMLLLILFHSCSPTDKKENDTNSGLATDTVSQTSDLTKNQKNGNFSADSKPMTDTFAFIDDSVVLPTFEIEIDLSEKAKRKIDDDRESIIVQAYFSGEPKDTTLEEYIEWGKVHLGSHKIELFDSRVARFENVKILKTAYNDLADKNFEVLINVFTGRRSSMYNLLDCDIFQDGIETIKGQRNVLKGKLL